MIIAVEIASNPSGDYYNIYDDTNGVSRWPVGAVIVRGHSYTCYSQDLMNEIPLDITWIQAVLDLQGK